MKGKILKGIALAAVALAPVMGMAQEKRSVPVRHVTITRTDTVAVLDTIIRRTLVERNEIVYRTESVILTDSVTPGANPFRGKVTESIETEISSKRNGEDELEITVAEAQPVAVAAQSSASVSEGGRMIWIPDSLAGDVEGLLKGKFRTTNGLEAVNTNEKAIFRGDTVPMVIRTRNLGRYDRGLFNHLFIPKGTWQIGATASYGEFSTEDLEVLDLLSDIDFSGHIFSVKPYFSYFIGNNKSVGMRLGYSSGKANIGSFKVDVDEDINFNLHDIMYRSESYTAAITYNQYFGITRRGRFGVYNEVELAFSSGNSDFVRPYNSILKTTHTTTMEAALNFSPGVSVFIMDPVSFHLSFGVFGFNLRHEKQMVDGEEMGSRTVSGANFRFNIFNINFGIAVNL